MKNLSIKWKLSLSLIGTGLCLVMFYVFIAKRTFESDKISYVFETQSSRVESVKREIGQHFERALLNARSVVATYDASQGKINLAGEQIFQEEKNLLALELWNEDTHQAVFRMEKVPGTLPSSRHLENAYLAGTLNVQTLPELKFLLVLRYSKGQPRLRLRAVVGFESILPTGDLHQNLILSQNGRLISSSEADGPELEIFQKAALETQKDVKDRTMIWEDGSNRFLMTIVSLGVSDLKLIALTPEKTALGALNTLFHRSILFLIFSGFGLVAISLTLARGLTFNLGILTEAARHFGKGNFDETPNIKSSDEIGVLSKAFTLMSSEIKRLLVETKDKARMEAELKTARYVQECLLPSQTSFEFNQIEVSGLNVTSSECGGDWWYYFTQGDDIFVAIADATGHGTPAALITAAARSIFSRFESDNIDLREMMLAWDRAVASCSQKKYFMTGILLRLNSKTGQGQFISAGHESPYLFTLGDDGYESGYVDLDVNASLGNGLKSSVHLQDFFLAPNANLFLFTDGLFSVEREGKMLSDRRFGLRVASRAEFAGSAQAMTRLAYEVFEEHRQGEALPDDVTMVTVRRKGPIRQAQLIDESGGVAINSVPN